MTGPVTPLDRLAARAGRLYSLPTVAMKVLELTNNPQVDVRALKQCIELDPALTGKILRVVNSSLFGLSRQVSDLNQALALLGTKPLKLLVLSFSLPSGLFHGVAGEVLGRYWRHALTKAVAGREISETIWNAPGDEAFIAGLLQDLGMLLLIQELGEPYIQFLGKVFALGKDLAALELRTMGFDHTMLSARLLAQWGLPQALVDAVAWQSNGQQVPVAPDHQALAEIVHLAELVARLLADGRRGVLAELLAAGRQYQQLSEAQLERLVDKLGEKVEQLADVLQLQLPAGLQYRDVLVQAHAQLAVVATQAAEEMLRGRPGEAVPPDEDPLLDETQTLAEVVGRLAQRRTDPPETAELRPPAEAAAPTLPVATAGKHPPEHPHHAEVPAPTAADSMLLERLAIAVTACRQSRCPLSLMLAELDRIDELAASLSPRQWERLRQAVETACRGVDHQCKICVPYAASGFALILPNCERRVAVELSNQLIDGVRSLLPNAGRHAQTRASLSVGVATVTMPPRNFPPEDLLSAASRCLYGSHASGGGVVKSIEIY